MDERIKSHLKYLNKYYLLLTDASKIPYDEFINNSVYQGSTERYLHLAIESCLNIGNRLLTLYQFTKPITTPETYSDIFKELGRIGVVDQDFSQRLIKMAKFRNRLVHLYWEIDETTIYQLIGNELGDFKLFEKCVVDFLKKNPLAK